MYRTLNPYTKFNRVDTHWVPTKLPFCQTHTYRSFQTIPKEKGHYSQAESNMC